MSAGHRDLTADEIHVIGWVQSGDPASATATSGLVESGKVWIDTSGGTGFWLIKVRNAGNDAWEAVAVAAAPSGGGYRFKDGNLQLWNGTQSKFHPVQITGAAGAEQIIIGAGEA